MSTAYTQRSNYSGMLTSLGEGKISPLYFAIGSDTYLYRQFVTQLVAAFKSRYGVNANYVQRWGVDLKTSNDVSSLIGGGGLFSSASLILLHEIQDSSTPVKTNLSEQLGNLPPDTVVLVHYSISGYRKAKWSSAMQNISQTVNLESPHGADLVNNVKEIALQYQVSIDNSGIHRLIELSSGELAIINNEIEKLSLYLDDPNAEVGKVLVDKVTGSVENAHVDQLVEAFSNRDRKAAIETLIQIHHQGKEGLPYLVAMLYNRLIQLMALHETPEARKAISQGATSYYALKHLISFDRNYTLSELQKAIRDLAKLDLQFRLGSTDMLTTFTTWVSKVV